MTTEQMLVCSRLFMLCAVILLVAAIIIFIIFDIKKIIKILRGKKIAPRQKTEKRIMKTELITKPLSDVQPMITVDISYIHSDVEI